MTQLPDFEKGIVILSEANDLSPSLDLDCYASAPWRCVLYCTTSVTCVVCDTTFAPLPDVAVTVML